MNEQDTTHPDSEVAPTRRVRSRRRAPRRGPRRRRRRPPRAVHNPGLARAHPPRMADLDEAAAKRAEKQVAAPLRASRSWARSVFIVCLLRDRPETRRSSSRASARPRPANLALGVTLAARPCSASASARCTGPRRSCPTRRSSRMRHTLRATDEARDRVVDDDQAGGAELAAHPPPAHQVHPRWRARPVRRAARPPGRSAASARCRRTSLSLTFWNGERRSRRQGRHIQAAAPHARPREHRRSRPSDVTIGSVFHVMPEGLLDPQDGTDLLEEKAKAAVLLMRLDPERHPVPEGEGLGLPGHRRLLQDLHPRRLPGRPLRAADPPPALPVPPVDLRRDAGLQGHLRSGQAAAAAAADHRRRRGLPRRQAAPFQEAVGPSFWERGSA